MANKKWLLLNLPIFLINGLIIWSEYIRKSDNNNNGNNNYESPEFVYATIQILKVCNGYSLCKYFYIVVVAGFEVDTICYTHLVQIYQFWTT